MTADGTDPSTPAERLAALLAGDPPTGRVLAEGTVRADVEQVLGPTGDEPDAVGRFGRSPATFREYDEVAIAPLGLTAWFSDDELLGIVVQLPELPRSWIEALGAPDRTEPSPVGRAIARAVWPAYGVVLHRHRATGDIERLDVLASAPVTLLDDELPPRRERPAPRDQP